MNLLQWINTHDCGVTPCAVMDGDTIVIRVLEVDAATKETAIAETRVSTLQEARDALGY